MSIIRSLRISSVLLRMLIIIGLLISVVPTLAHAKVANSSIVQTASENKPKPFITKTNPLPLQFVPNVGQYEESAGQYRTNAQSIQVDFNPTTIDYRWTLVPPQDHKNLDDKRSDRIKKDRERHKQATSYTIQTQFIKAQSTTVITHNAKMPGVMNYVLPTKMITNVSSYAGVTYQNMYRGIDLVFDGTNGALKSTWVVTAGANPLDIRWQYNGAKQVKLAKNGDLIVTSPNIGKGQKSVQFSETAPIAWQDIDGKRVMVEVRYQIDKQQVGFRVGRYDVRYPLIIDPTLVYTYKFYSGTYIGYGITLDQASNTYTSGAGSSGGFVVRSDANGTSQAWMTTIPGNYANVTALVFDPVFGLYGVGSTDTGGFFLQIDPVTGAIIHNVGLGQFSTLDSIAIDSVGSLYFIADGQLVKTNGSGVVQYTITIPSISLDAVDVNASNQVAVAGYTTGTPYQENVYVGLLSQQGTVISSSTFGGTWSEYASDVAIGDDGMIYVTGSTRSDDFPLLNPVQNTHVDAGWCDGGCPDAFITKINPTNQTIMFSTFLGGSGAEWVQAIAVEGNQLSVAGVSMVDTDPAGTLFPLVSAIGSNDGNYADTFVAKLTDQNTNNGYTIQYSTLLGDANYDESWAMIMRQGNVFVAGATSDYNDWNSYSAFVARIDDAPPIVAGGDVVNINFQPANAPVPIGYLPDAGQNYANRGNNWSYGWLNSEYYVFASDMNMVADQRYDTMVSASPYNTPLVDRWEIDIPNGRYKVRAIEGSPVNISANVWVQSYVEGVLLSSGERTPTQKWIDNTVQVEVHDGRLTVTMDGRTATQWSLAFLEVSHATTPNLAPVVNMTDMENTTFKANQPITLHADAYDPDGHIAEVKFFADGVYLGSDTTAPYSYNWGCPNYDIPCMANIPTGSHSVRANAIDDSGATTFSDLTTITINPAIPANQKTEFDVELKIFLPYQWADIPGHPLYFDEVAKGDDRTWSSTAQRYRIAQSFTMIPKIADDTDGTPDGVKAGSFHNLVNTSINYDRGSSVNPDTLRLTQAAKNEPLDLAHIGIPYMVNYGPIPQSELDANMHMTPLSYTSPYTRAVQLQGEASDPIIFIACDIDWNLQVEIDQSVSPPQARVIGQHQAFPAYEVYVDGQPIYQWKPPVGNSVLDLCNPDDSDLEIKVTTPWIAIR